MGSRRAVAVQRPSGQGQPPAKPSSSALAESRMGSIMNSITGGGEGSGLLATSRHASKKIRYLIRHASEPSAAPAPAVPPVSRHHARHRCGELAPPTHPAPLVGAPVSSLQGSFQSLPWGAESLSTPPLLLRRHLMRAITWPAPTTARRASGLQPAVNLRSRSVPSRRRSQARTWPPQAASWFRTRVSVSLSGTDE